MTFFRFTRRRVLIVGVIVAAAALAALLFRPDVYQVDVARAARGPLRVTLDEDAVTRVRHHVEIDAPVTGRIAENLVVAGDSVVPGMILGRVYPAPLDPRAREQAAAAAEGARSLRSEATARVQQAQVTLDEARRARARAETLREAGAISARDLEQAVAEERLRERDLEAAGSRERAAAQDERRAGAALLDADPSRLDAGAPVALRAPIAGRVLHVFEEHERVVPAGTPLLDIGDPTSLEIVADVLTRDATDVRAGAPMLVRVADRPVLRARVRRIEPAAFTKVSPLGVEEQRVNVVGEFLDPPVGLGDRFEVDASIVLWEGDHVLQVPGGALVPVGSGWGVFVVRNGRANLRTVGVGHRAARDVEVQSGLHDGDTVIVHPDERIRNGVRITPRR